MLQVPRQKELPATAILKLDFDPEKRNPFFWCWKGKNEFKDSDDELWSLKWCRNRSTRFNARPGCRHTEHSLPNKFYLKEAIQNLATCGLFILYTTSSEKRVGGFTKIEVEESRQSQLPRRGKFPWYTRVLKAVGVKPSNKGSSIM